MNFLEKLGFTSDDIEEIIDSIPNKLIDLIKEQKKLVTENLEYLRDLGVKNYPQIFIRYADMFLMDTSNFKAIFSKYDQEDLVQKLAKNIKIVEFL